MSPIDPILLKKYQMMLQNEKIPKNEQSYFLKWLRYYLDFCHKYGFEKTDTNILHPYIDKLDGFVKSPTSALRFILRFFMVR